VNTIDKVRKAITLECVSYVHNDEDNYDKHTYDGLCGHRDKTYYRIDTRHFASLIRELNDNPETGYVTNINELITTGYVPKKVSVLDKVINSNNYKHTSNILKLVYAEVLASRILNYFGCPTTYNVAVEMTDDEKNDNYHILSLDFLSYGEEFYSFCDFDCSFAGELVDNVRMIKYEFRMGYFGDYIKEELDKVVEDYVYSFLVRRHILRDSDFYDSNSGIILNKETGSARYINFDFEYTFNSSRAYLEENLLYCKDTYPEVYAKFRKNTIEFYSGLKYLYCSFEIQNNDHIYREMMESLLMELSGIINVMNKLTKMKKKR